MAWLAVVLAAQEGAKGLAADPAAWVQRLGDESPAVRDRAVRALVRAGEAAAPALEEAARASDPVERMTSRVGRVRERPRR